MYLNSSLNRITKDVPQCSISTFNKSYCCCRSSGVRCPDNVQKSSLNALRHTRTNVATIDILWSPLQAAVYEDNFEPKLLHIPLTLPQNLYHVAVASHCLLVIIRFGQICCPQQISCHTKETLLFVECYIQFIPRKTNTLESQNIAPLLSCQIWISCHILMSGVGEGRVVPQYLGESLSF